MYYYLAGLSATSVLKPRMRFGRLMSDDALSTSMWQDFLRSAWDGKLLVFRLSPQLADSKSLEALQAKLRLTRLVSLLR